MAIVAVLRGRCTLDRGAFAAGMVLLGAEAVFTGLTLRSDTLADVLFWQTAAHIVQSFLPATWLLFSLVYARGNARKFLSRQRYMIAGGFVAATLLSSLFWRDMVMDITLDRSTATLGWPGLLVHVGLLMGFIFALMDLERTYRTAVGMTRWRIKYMLLGLMVLFVVRIYTSSQALLYNAVDLSLVGIQTAALLLAQILMVRSFVRAGHFSADLYPSQSVLRGSITVILAGGYLLVVGVLAKFAATLGATEHFPLQAFVVLLSLVVLALVIQSDHARMRLRRFVSRHFQRPRVDFRTTWQKFAAHATTAEDSTSLCRNVVALIAETFEVLWVTAWIMGDRRDALIIAASSDSATADAPEPLADAHAVSDLVRYFHDHPEAIDLEDVKVPWTEALKHWHPNAFTTGGHRVAIPLIARGELLGLIMVGDRVGGEIFTPADLDVFKCVGDHVAASLLNAQLAQRLLQVKELESFQLMATFFVHDLKNAANTLNLLLRNLPEHFHEAEFREDALRGCAKTVDHMNSLISRLTELRQELRVQPTATDLNDFVRRALAEFPASDAITVTQDLRPTPPVLLDAEQMRKVVANLLLNAREAISTTGTIRVTTHRQNGKVELAVADTGCGMNPEFVRKSLFRPFQTTKQRGLGIGMFQTKMIVEAHGGRIDVDSAPGRGTTFRISLPCPEPSA